MEMLLDKDLTEIEKRDLRLHIAEKYNWLKIAEQTIGGLSQGAGCIGQSA